MRIILQNDISMKESIKNSLSEAEITAVKENLADLLVKLGIAANSRDDILQYLGSIPRQSSTIHKLLGINPGSDIPKYNENNKPLICMMTQSTCYKSTRHMEIKGILWHSTGANNPRLSRYVQPDDNASNRAEMLKLIGKNSTNSDWNHISI